MDALVDNVGAHGASHDHAAVLVTLGFCKTNEDIDQLKDPKSVWPLRYVIQLTEQVNSSHAALQKGKELVSRLALAKEMMRAGTAQVHFGDQDQELAQRSHKKIRRTYSELSPNIDAEDLVKVALGELRRVVHHGDASVGDDAGDWAHLAVNLVEGLCDLLLVGHVTLEGFTSGVVLLCKLGCDFGGVLAASVDDGDASAGLGSSFGNGFANTTVAAGDDDALARD